MLKFGKPYLLQIKILYTYVCKYLCGYISTQHYNYFLAFITHISYIIYTINIPFSQIIILRDQVMIVLAYNNYYDHPLPRKDLNDETSIEVMSIFP